MRENNIKTLITLLSQERFIPGNSNFNFGDIQDKSKIDGNIFKIIGVNTESEDAFSESIREALDILQAELRITNDAIANNVRTLSSIVEKNKALQRANTANAANQ